MSVEIDRSRLYRFGLDVSDVQRVVQIATGGVRAGDLFEGDRRFEIVVRLPEELRANIEALRSLAIPLSHSSAANDDTVESNTPWPYIPLSEVAKIRVSPGPNQISRENGKRRIVVTANVRGRDLGSFVKEAQQAVEDGVTLKAGYWVHLGRTV